MCRFTTIVKLKEKTVEMSGDGSNQPVFDEGKTLSIVFDGEIYNLKALKKELRCDEPPDGLQTDAGLILSGYRQWGIEQLLHRLDGAFAFTLHDRIDDTTYIVRDKFGITPLYYFQDSTGLYAASTLRLLSRHSFPKIISKEGLNLFFSLTYIPAPYTIYENVFKLCAGQYITIHNEQTLLKSYYRLEDHIRPSAMKFEQAKHQLRRLVTDSVKNMMETERPTGVLLSGGIDSCIVAGVLSQHSPQPVPTFSIGFKAKELDESDRAQLVSDAFHTDHTVHFLDFADVSDVIDDMIRYFDEPFADSSAIPTYYAAKLAGEKVQAVFTGDCADELFGGYKKYLSEHNIKNYLRVPKPVRCLFEKMMDRMPGLTEKFPVLRKMKRLVSAAAVSKFEVNYQYMCIGCNDQVRARLIRPGFYTDIKPVIEQTYQKFANSDVINAAMYTDMSVSLEGDMFPKMERMCSMNALTARSPFSTAELFHFAMSLPAAFKVRGKKKKYILREAFKDLLPSKIYQTNRKQGFSAPVAHWLRNELAQDLTRLTDKDTITRQGVLDDETVAGLVAQHLHGKADHSSLLWALLVFQKWYEKNISV